MVLEIGKIQGYALNSMFRYAGTLTRADRTTEKYRWVHPDPEDPELTIIAGITVQGQHAILVQSPSTIRKGEMLTIDGSMYRVNGEPIDSGIGITLINLILGD